MYSFLHPYTYLGNWQTINFEKKKLGTIGDAANEHHGVRGKIEYREAVTHQSYGLTYRSSLRRLHGTADWPTRGSLQVHGRVGIWQQASGLWGSESTALQLLGVP